MRNRMRGLISEKYLAKRNRRFFVEEINYCVYFVTDGEFVKIGSAASLPNRIKQLQTGNARKLKALFVVNVENQDEAIKTEHDIHKMFENYHVSGEWFKLDQVDIERKLLKAGYDIGIPVSKHNFDVEGIEIAI